MGIFSRMTNIINSNPSALLDRAEDPKKMILKKSIIVLAILSLGGCAIGSDNDKTFENYRSTTIGQELIDLKKAYDEKIITPKEYDKLKQDIQESASLSTQVSEYIIYRKDPITHHH